MFLLEISMLKISPFIFKLTLLFGSRDNNVGATSL